MKTCKGHIIVGDIADAKKTSKTLNINNNISVYKNVKMSIYVLNMLWEINLLIFLQLMYEAVESQDNLWRISLVQISHNIVFPVCKELTLFY